LASLIISAVRDATAPLGLISARGLVRCRTHAKLLSTARGVFWRSASALPGGPDRIAPAHGLSMLAKLASYTLIGIDATPVEVEVDVSFSSMPKTVLVGLVETAIKESTQRVGRAIANSSCRNRSTWIAEGRANGVLQGSAEPVFETEIRQCLKVAISRDHGNVHNCSQRGDDHIHLGQNSSTRPEMLIELAIDSRDWWVDRPDTNSNQ